MQNSFSNGNRVIVQEEGESSNGNGPRTSLPLNGNNKSGAASSSCEKCGVLPPMAETNQNKRTLVLDLDETLVYVTRTPMPAGYDYSITFRGRDKPSYYVLKRPGVDELLQQLGATGLYEIVVFTAASKEYADAVVDGLLDSLPASDSSDIHKNRYIIPPTHRLSSSHCREVEGVLNDVKDLSVLGRDLKNVIFVDDRCSSYYLQPQNAIPVKSWEGEDVGDKAIFIILSFCLKIAQSTTDVRELVSNHPDFRTHHFEFLN